MILTTSKHADHWPDWVRQWSIDNGWKICRFTFQDSNLKLPTSIENWQVACRMSTLGRQLQVMVVRFYILAWRQQFCGHWADSRTRNEMTTELHQYRCRGDVLATSFFRQISNLIMNWLNRVHAMNAPLSSGICSFSYIQPMLSWIKILSQLAYLYYRVTILSIMSLQER